MKSFYTILKWSTLKNVANVLLMIQLVKTHNQFLMFFIISKHEETTKNLLYLVLYQTITWLKNVLIYVAFVKSRWKNAKGNTNRRFYLRRSCFRKISRVINTIIIASNQGYRSTVWTIEQLPLIIVQLRLNNYFYRTIARLFLISL